MGDAALGLLLGVVGTIASVVSCVIAYIQTIRLRDVKRRSSKDIMLAIGEAAGVVEQLEPLRDEAPRAYQTALSLHSELLKEAVLQESKFDEDTIQRWREAGILGEWQMVSARRLIDTTSKRRRPTIDSAEPVPVDIRNSGLKTVYKQFPMDDVIQRIRKANRSIRIYTTWVNDLHRVEPAIQDAMWQQSCRARILLIDPDSTVAKQRSDDIKRVGAEYVINAVKSNVEELISFFGANEARKGSLEVRLYRSYPTFLMYGWDDHIVYSTILKERMTMEGPQFAIEGEGTPLYKLIESQFEIMWQNARVAFTTRGRAGSADRPSSST